MTYFAKAGWPHDWIKTAKEIVRKEWEESYKPGSTSTAVGARTLSNIVYFISFSLHDKYSCFDRTLEAHNITSRKG